MKPTEYLRQWLETEAAPWRIGQVLIKPGYFLRHLLDDGHADLLPVESLAALRQIVKYNVSGRFRPVRGAPDLQTGWVMGPLSLPALMEALNVIYPAAIAQWAHGEEKTLPVTEYQETAERQTGMYQITRTLGDERLVRLTEEVCVPGCLRKRLWSPRSKIENQKSEIPLLCPEACNYLIGRAREMVKGRVDGE